MTSHGPAATEASRRVAGRWSRPPSQPFPALSSAPPPRPRAHVASSTDRPLRKTLLSPSKKSDHGSAAWDRPDSAELAKVER